MHTAEGPGTETFVLGGHQSAGQAGQGTSSTVQVGATGSETGATWRAGQGLSTFRTKSEGDTEAHALSGTVERNAHTPKKGPLHLVQCDLLVTMVAEVKVTGGGPYVATGARTLPAAAGVWLTEEQLPEALRRGLRPGAQPSTASSAPRGNPAESSRTAAERTAAERTTAERTTAERTTGQEDPPGPRRPPPAPPPAPDSAANSPSASA